MSKDMKQQDNEYISALLDNELDDNARDLVKRMSSDNEMKATWTRYQTISDVMHGENTGYTADLVNSISEKLTDEPTVLAPSKSSIDVKRYFKPLSGLAIAASVAAVAIISIQQLQHSVPGSGFETPATIASTSSSELVEPALVANSVQTEALTDNQKAALQSRLDHYLLNHYQRNNTKGVQGVMPYARIVTHEIETK